MKKLLFFVGLAIFWVSLQAQSLPSGFSVTDATSSTNWTQPVGAAFSKNGDKLFVWEKRGQVFVCNRQPSGQYTKQLAPVINISEEVGDWNDFGLVGFALDPDFASNGYIYLLYVVDRHHLKHFGTGTYSSTANEYNNATIGRITRYTTAVNPTTTNLVADPTSRKVLLGETISTGIPVLHRSHGVGSLAFAADGTLLVTAGDGASFDATDIGDQHFADYGSEVTNSYNDQGLADGIIRANEDVGAYRSQMLNSHNGKLLRIDPANGDGVSSNPFFDPANPRSAKSRVYAFGFRNPFRMSVKPGSGSQNPSAGDIGEVFIGDVGWGEWEEFNIVKSPGTNFGWPIYQGCNISIEGGYNGYGVQYRDETYFPNCRASGYMNFNELIKQDNAAGIANIYNPCSSGTEISASGKRYLHARPALDWGRNPGSTRVSRYDEQGQAINPTIGTPESNVTATSTFSGNASSGGIWYVGTGNSFPENYKNTFLLADFGGQWIKKIGVDFTDVVTSVDDFVNQAGAVVCIAENPIDGSIVYVNVGTEEMPGSVLKVSYGGNVPPIAKITANKNYSADPTTTINFSAQSSTDKDGSITSYLWDFGDEGSSSNSSTDINASHEFSTVPGVPKKFIVKLTVTDNQGASDEEEFVVSVNNTPPQVSIISPINNSTYRIGGDTIYQLKANVVDAEHSTGELTYAWQTTLKHNTHSHPEAIDPNVETTTSIARIGCDYDNYHWHIQLTVTDAAGLSTNAVSQIYPNCAGALPLTLRKFSVTQKSSVNIVNWTTELESNIEFFEIERSTDGVNFSSINRQDARNIQGTSHYTYSDRDFLPGYNYYRLKIVEHGAAIRYSVIVRTIAEEENLNIKVVPNPVVGNFSVVYKSRRDDVVNIQIRDISGRLLHTVKENVNRGQNVVYLQNLPNWPGGVYFLSIQGSEEIKQTKFVKAR